MLLFFFLVYVVISVLNDISKSLIGQRVFISCIFARAKGTLGSKNGHFIESPVGSRDKQH